MTNTECHLEWQLPSPFGIQHPKLLSPDTSTPWVTQLWLTGLRQDRAGLIGLLTLDLLSEVTTFLGNTKPVGLWTNKHSKLP